MSDFSQQHRREPLNHNFETRTTSRATCHHKEQLTTSSDTTIGPCLEEMVSNFERLISFKMDDRREILDVQATCGPGAKKDN